MVRTVGTVTGATPDEMLRRALSAGTDLVEFRLDHLDAPSPHAVEALRARWDGPAIATVRTTAEGGRFAGPAAAAAALAEAAAGAGFAMVDVELAWPDAAAVIARCRSAGAIVVGSAHLGHAPGEEEALLALRFAHATGADIAKLAAPSETPAQLAALASASRRAVAQGIPVAVMGTGDTTLRAGAAGLGASLVYCAVGDGTAPGQLPAALQRSLSARAGPRVGGSTRIVALLGSPVAHSLSPAMMNAAFGVAGIDAVFVCVETPAGMANAGLEALKTTGALGGSVTTPHKAAVAGLARCTPAAAAVGAANAFAFRDGRLEATNTDGSGAVRALAARDVALDGARVLVVGAGATGRAIAHAASGAGARVTVANRDATRASAAARLAKGDAVPFSAAALSDAARTADVLVNATTLSDLPIPDADLPDAILQAPYATRSPLVERARAAHATALDGLDLLWGQGVDAFRFWTGADAPEGVMRHALREARIERRLLGADA